MKKFKLVHGDCTKEMSKIPDHSIDLILCDLPYGTTACAWDTIIPFDILWGHYTRVAKKNANILLFASQPFTSLLITSNLKLFKYCLIWDKAHGKAPGVAKYRPMPSFEDIAVFGLPKTKYNPGTKIVDTAKKAITGKSRSKEANTHKFGYSGTYQKSGESGFPLSVITIKSNGKVSDEANVHPTQKPVKLLEKLIKMYSDEGDLVLDNTMGSGSTGVAALLNNRRFIGIEKESHYYNIAKKRIESLPKKLF